MREAVASGECLTTHCKTGDNYSDMMNKVLYGQKQQYNVSRILYEIWDHEDGPEPAKEWFFSCLYAMTQDHDAYTPIPPRPRRHLFACILRVQNQHPLWMMILRGLIKYAHNTIMSVRTTGWHERYHRKIPLFCLRKRKQTAVSMTANVCVCLACAHALWLMT